MTNQFAQADVAEQPACNLVEVLTAEHSGETIGYAFGGNNPGPNAVITGATALIEALYDRLGGLPTLPWMWGKLYLVEIDGIEVLDVDDVKSCLADVVIDDLIMLPHPHGTAEICQHSVERAYWATLRLCRQLGMIEGRGVS